MSEQTLIYLLVVFLSMQASLMLVRVDAKKEGKSDFLSLMLNKDESVIPWFLIMCSFFWPVLIILLLIVAVHAIFESTPAPNLKASITKFLFKPRYLSSTKKINELQSRIDALIQLNKELKNENRKGSNSSR